MLKYLKAGSWLAIIFLWHGCAVAPVALREYPVQQPKDNVLVLIQLSHYKMGLAEALALRLNHIKISVCIDDVVNASDYRAANYGAVLLIVNLGKEQFSEQAIEFLNKNAEAHNLALYVTKKKKIMQLPKEIVSLKSIDTVTSASIVHPQEDMLNYLEVLLRKRLNL